MSNMFSQFDRVALDFPGAAFRRRELVFVRVITFLKAAGKSADFLMCRFRRIILRSSEAYRLPTLSSVSASLIGHQSKSW
jgi:hypothetical protein